MLHLVSTRSCAKLQAHASSLSAQTSKAKQLGGLRASAKKGVASAKHITFCNATPLKPADHETSPFAELGVCEIWDGTGRTRVRQHVNPLRSQYQIPTGPLNWKSMFADPKRPLVVDLGCGPGRFLLLMHYRHSRQLEQQQSFSDTPDNTPQPSGQKVLEPLNYLGVEIRQPLVDRARTWAARLGCEQNVQFVYSNATISLATMLSSYPGPVRLVCIQFPDPHFKRRNHKRRIFQPNLVRDIASVLEPGGSVLLQSDVERVAVAMRNVFEHQGITHFDPAPEHSSPEATFSSAPGALQGDDNDGNDSELEGNAAADSATATLDEVQEATQQGLHTQEGRAACVSHSSTQHAGQQAKLCSSAHSHREQGAGEVSAQNGSRGEGDPEKHNSLQNGEESQHQGEERRRRRQKDDEGDWENMESQWAASGWLKHNPVGVPTEREIYVQQQQLPVYRVLLKKK